MKIKTKLYFPLALFALAAVACVKNPGNGGDGGSTPGSVKELTIPEGFAWKTTSDIACNFTSAHDVKVYVSTTENGGAFASFIAGPDVEKVTLSVPAHTEKLYVKYETASGLSSAVPLSVAAGQVTYAVPVDAKQYVAASAASDSYEVKTAGAPAVNYDGAIYYPAVENGWGTLMFEDLWPSYGDYDFNDMVVNYKIQLYTQNKNKVRYMMVGFRIKAMGGSLPYELYLKMHGVKGGEIASIELLSYKNLSVEPQMLHLNPGNPVKDPAIFQFKGIRENPNKPAGSTYLNTEPGKEMEDKDLAEVVFFVEFRNSIANEDVALDLFDFFIAKPSDVVAGELKEIHGGEFKATELGEQTYWKLGGESIYTNKNRSYYYSATNLVWMLNVPSDIPHAYETVDFTKAYPNFASWAQSGGTQNKDWYENKPGNRVSTNLVK